jgi:hypothetical protein
MGVGNYISPHRQAKPLCSANVYLSLWRASGMLLALFLGFALLDFQLEMQEWGK